jgi:hypothetical protein
MKERKSGELKYKVFSRINKQKYEQLQSMLGASHCRTMSELIRHILEKEKITVVTRDGTLDTVMEQLSGIRKELQSIGININQVTHRFHIEDQPEGRIFQALEIAKLYQQTEQKVTELFTVISKISERWLPE